MKSISILFMSCILFVGCAAPTMNLVHADYESKKSPLKSKLYIDSFLDARDSSQRPLQSQSVSAFPSLYSGKTTPDVATYVRDAFVADLTRNGAFPFTFDSLSATKLKGRINTMTVYVRAGGIHWLGSGIAIGLFFVNPLYSLGGILLTLADTQVCTTKFDIDLAIEHQGLVIYRKKLVYEKSDQLPGSKQSDQVSIRAQKVLDNALHLKIQEFIDEASHITIPSLPKSSTDIPMANEMPVNSSPSQNEMESTISSEPATNDSTGNSAIQ